MNSNTKDYSHISAKDLDVKMIKKLNIIIAESLGYTGNTVTLFQVYQKPNGINVAVDDLAFNTSWDELIPVYTLYKYMNYQNSELSKYHTLFLLGVSTNDITMSFLALVKLLTNEKTVHKNIFINGFAPGNYQCKCGKCDKFFFGDKRAVRCDSCVITGINKNHNMPLSKKFINNDKLINYSVIKFDASEETMVKSKLTNYLSTLNLSGLEKTRIHYTDAHGQYQIKSGIEIYELFGISKEPENPAKK